MASGNIQSPNKLSKIYSLGENDSITFDLPSARMALIAVSHPYTGDVYGGLYLVVGGYTTTSHATAIKESSIITIEKPTNTTVKVSTTVSTFVGVYLFLE